MMDKVKTTKATCTCSEMPLHCIKHHSSYAYSLQRLNTVTRSQLTVLCSMAPI